MATLVLPKDFREFFQSLNSHKVKYLLIGGYAVGYYGYPRFTADIDVWVAIHPDNAQRLVTAIKEFGFDASKLSTKLFLQKNKVIRMGLPPMRIEILTSISGVHFDSCYKQRKREMIDGIVVPLISLQHLKTNKKASGRLKDLNDLQNL